MLKFVKAFDSMDLIRNFLKTRNLIDELLGMEIGSGNYLEAVKLARIKGNLLLEADMLEKVGRFKKASQLIILHVVMNSLWADGSEGWPLKWFQRKEDLLIRAKSLAEKVSNDYYQSVCTEAVILLDQTTNLSNLLVQFNDAQRFQNIRPEIFAAHKLLDTHLQLDPSKFHWKSETGHDSSKHVDEMMSHNCVSVETLIYSWDLWKERILNILSYLQSLGKTAPNESPLYVDFCSEYFGVRRGDTRNTFIVLNSEVYWFKKSDGHALHPDKNMFRMNKHQFAKCVQNCCALELLSVSIKLLERLDFLHKFCTNKSKPLFCQGQILLHVFDVARCLNESKDIDRKHTAIGRVTSFLDLAKRCFLDEAFPLEFRKAVTKRMVCIRENEIGRDIPDEILTENLNPKNGRLTHGRVGRVILFSGRLTDDLYQKINICLDKKLPWKSFIEQLKTYFDMGFGRFPLVFKFQDALASTYAAPCREYDYMSPSCFMYLFECLAFLASSCLQCGSFYATNSTFFEMATCEVWKSSLGTCLPVSDEQFQSNMSKLLQFLATTAEELRS